MNWIYKTGLWVGATAVMAAMAFATGQQDAGDRAKAEKILNTSCTGCHDLRKVQTQAMDEESWTKTVNSMIDKGAKVQKEDIPLFVSYLEDNFGPLPDGPGKEVVLNKCTVCHDLRRVRQHFATPEDWADLLGAMENEGLMLSDEEYVAALKYLARNFRQ
jgi:cytochrome c5